MEEGVDEQVVSTRWKIGFDEWMPPAKKEDRTTLGAKDRFVIDRCGRRIVRSNRPRVEALREGIGCVPMETK